MSKEIATVKTYTYTVYTREGCEVTDTATGMRLITAEPGKPNYFSAMGDSVTLSDDAAIVFKPVFKCALAALGLLGEGTTLPAGYTRLEFLGGTGTPYINTGVVKSGEFRASFDYAGADRLINGKLFGWQYSEDNTTYQNLFRFQALSYLGRFSHDSTQIYILPASYNQQGYIGTERNRLESTDALNRVVLNGNAVSLSLLSSSVYNNANPRNEPVCLWFPEGVKIYAFSIFNDAAKDVEYIPALDPSGVPCMYDLVSKQPFRNVGSGQFIAGVGSVAQLRSILSKLPATGGELTLSLPAEANTPEVSAELQACHDTKGWTLTVYEYRPAAVVTYSLRRVRQVVWCRKQAAEYGGYVDAAGKRWQVERCAAIFGSLGQDPAAYGYSPFDSVEQAAERWQLAPYEEPEKEKLNLEK